MKAANDGTNKQICLLDGTALAIKDGVMVRVPLCVRVSRVCPGSPRCLFTGLIVIPPDQCQVTDIANAPGRAAARVVSS